MISKFYFVELINNNIKYDYMISTACYPGGKQREKLLDRLQSGSK